MWKVRSAGGKGQGEEGGGGERGQSVFQRQQTVGSAAPASPEPDT